jgi:hypothetical protein
MPASLRPPSHQDRNPAGVLRRGYERRVILRIIMRHLPPECRCLRSFPTSEGMGGAVPSRNGRGPEAAWSGSVYG